jgi:hypothetical protein
MPKDIGVTGKMLNYAGAPCNEADSSRMYLGIWGVVQVALNIAGVVLIFGIIMTGMRPSRFEGVMIAGGVVAFFFCPGGSVICWAWQGYHMSARHKVILLGTGGFASLLPALLTPLLMVLLRLFFG